MRGAAWSDQQWALMEERGRDREGREQRGSLPGFVLWERDFLSLRAGMLDCPRFSIFNAGHKYLDSYTFLHVLAVLEESKR